MHAFFYTGGEILKARVHATCSVYVLDEQKKYLNSSAFVEDLPNLAVSKALV